MSKADLLARIESNPAVVTGKPVIRGTRLTVGFVVGLLASGATPEEIVAEYPGLSREDIQACLLFAAQTLEDTSFRNLAMPSLARVWDNDADAIYDASAV